MPEPLPRTVWKHVMILAVLGFVFALLCPVLDGLLLHVKQSLWTELLLRIPHIFCPFWILSETLPWYGVAALNVAFYGSLGYISMNVRRSGWILVGILIACIAAVTIYGFHLRRTAAHILEDISALKVGQSTFDDVARIAAKYASRATCEWTFPIAVPGLKQWPEKYISTVTHNRRYQ